jgi:hypothetical protein
LVNWWFFFFFGYGKPSTYWCHNILHQSQSMKRSSRKDSYRQIQCNKDSHKFSFFCQTIKDWTHKLSPDIAKNTTTESFKGVCCMYGCPSLTFSSEFMFSFVWGSQTVQQYSNLGLIRVWYARSFTQSNKWKYRYPYT